jgi:hypothetical protein
MPYTDEGWPGAHGWLERAQVQTNKHSTPIDAVDAAMTEVLEEFRALKMAFQVPRRHARTHTVLLLRRPAPSPAAPATPSGSHRRLDCIGGSPCHITDGCALCARVCALAHRTR